MPYSFCIASDTRPPCVSRCTNHNEEKYIAYCEDIASAVRQECEPAPAAQRPCVDGLESGAPSSAYKSFCVLR